MNRRLVWGIVFLGLMLRLVALSKYPYGFTPDEASFGYDAYSLIKTGKDQWGSSWPLVLKSFGDYKAPVYSYITIPSILLFGLTKFAVRLPNVLFGAAAIYATYLLVGELFSRDWGHASEKLAKNRWALAAISSLLLAISPWHIMMSRGAFEANLTTFLLPLGIYLFLKGLSGKSYAKINLSAIVFGLDLFTYHSAKLVVPVTVAALILTYLKDLRKLKLIKLMSAAAIFCLFCLVTFWTLYQGAGSRASQISIFNAASEASASGRLTAIDSGIPEPVARLFYNKYRVMGERFLANYVQYTSLRFLFVSGPAETTYGMIPGRGVLYLFEAVFLAGLFFHLFKNGGKNLRVIVVWLVVAPIPAALTVGFGYSANRAVIMLPAMQVLLAVGALSAYDWLRSMVGPKMLKLLSYGFVGVALVLVISFFEDYFVQSPIISEKGMSYGILEAGQWLSDNAAGREIIMSTTLSEPHMYVAFASAWDPQEVQTASAKWDLKASGVEWVDQLPVYQLENYTFRRIDWVHDSTGDAVLVGRPDEFPENAVPIKTIYYPDGDVSVIVVDPTIQTYAWKNN